jgi:hypothetical protein
MKYLRACGKTDTQGMSFLLLVAAAIFFVGYYVYTDQTDDGHVPDQPITPPPGPGPGPVPGPGDKYAKDHMFEVFDEDNNEISDGSSEMTGGYLFKEKPDLAVTTTPNKNQYALADESEGADGYEFTGDKIEQQINAGKLYEDHGWFYCTGTDGSYFDVCERVPWEFYYSDTGAGTRTDHPIRIQGHRVGTLYLAGTAVTNTVDNGCTGLSFDISHQVTINYSDGLVSLLGREVLIVFTRSSTSSYNTLTLFSIDGNEQELHTTYASATAHAASGESAGDIYYCLITVTNDSDILGTWRWVGTISTSGNGIAVPVHVYYGAKGYSIHSSTDVGSGISTPPGKDW